MVTEDYCDFETAKLLKEKGFDIPCREHYYQYGKLSPYPTEYNWNCEEDYYSCSTLQIVMKWMREVHDIFIEISVDEEFNEHGYQWSLFDNTTKRIRPYAGWGDTYEQSCEKAIKYCLENLI